MKKRIMQTFAVAALVISLAFAAHGANAAGSNLVPNGDFETVASGAQTLPQGWTTDTWGTMSSTFTYPVAGNASSKAAQVKVTSYNSGDAKWMFDHIPVTAGTAYTYSDTYIGTVPTEIDVEYKSKTGALSYVVLGTAPATGANWGTFTVQLTPPANTASMSVLHLIQSVGTLTIDNVSVTSGTTPPPPPPPAQKPTISSFTANPASITSGQSSTLSWAVANASSTSINQGVGVVTGTSKSVTPTQTTVYVITATNPAGSVSATTTVTVIQTPPPPPPPAQKPTISSFTATPSSIAAGSSTVLAWSVANASSTSINQGVGTVTGTSKSVNPTQTTTYTLTATNPAGSATTTATVTVTPAPPPPPPPGNNLITNGTFEAGSGSTPTGWNADYWGSLTPTFTYPVAGIGSAKAAKVVVTNWRSGDAKWWFNHVPVSDSTVYLFKDDYISNVVTNITIEFKMSNGTFQYQWVSSPAATGAAGASVQVQVTVPKGAVSMTVLHALTSNGSLTIDNASLTALPANPFPSGMVTFTFDDGLVSQYNNARPILNTAGLKASYAIITQGVRDFSGDTASMTWAQITQLKNDGNEIAAHTRTHPDLTTLTSAQAQSEIKGSYDDLVAKGFTPKSFVYPLGGVNPAIETLVQNDGFTSARGSYWGMNTPTADKYALYDMRLDQTVTIAQAKAMVDQAFADKRWLVLELHDVLASGGDSYSITPAFLQQLVTYIKQKGITTVTLEQGRALMQ